MNCSGAVTCSESELQTVSCDIRVFKRYKTLIDSLLTEGFFHKESNDHIEQEAYQKNILLRQLKLVLRLACEEVTRKIIIMLLINLGKL